MGSVVAQRVWRQHPDVVGGLVLGATTDHFRTNGREMFFHNGMEISMGALRAMARSRVVRRAARVGADALDIEPNDIDQWALAEWRSTSPWAVAQALASLGRHHSTPVAGAHRRADRGDGAADRLGDPARRGSAPWPSASPAPPSTRPTAATAACVLESEIFAPAFLEAALDVAARMEPPRPRAVPTRKKAAATTA